MVSNALKRIFPGRRARFSVSVVLLVAMVVVIMLAMELQSRYSWAEGTVADIAPRYSRLAGLQHFEPQIASAVEASVAQLERFAFPAATSADRIGTELQQRTRQIAEASGLSVLNSRILPAKSVDAIELIAVMITLQGDSASIRAMLLALPQERPTLQLDAATMQVARVRDQSGQITSQFTISAMRFKE